MSAQAHLVACKPTSIHSLRCYLPPLHALALPCKKRRIATPVTAVLNGYNCDQAALAEHFQFSATYFEFFSRRYEIPSAMHGTGVIVAATIVIHELLCRAATTDRRRQEWSARAHTSSLGREEWKKGERNCQGLHHCWANPASNHLP